MMVHSLTLENDGLKAKVVSLKQMNEELISTNIKHALHHEETDEELQNTLADLKSIPTCFECKRAHYANSD